MKIFAIDPGNTYSAYVLLEIEDEKARILCFAKDENLSVMSALFNFVAYDKGSVVIERVQGMGMAVGREVFETCEWVGRYSQLSEMYGKEPNYVYRKDEKLTLCGDSRAKDANIRQALIDRYATFDFKTGRGTKANPDTLYGIKADCWSALAVATTFIEMDNGSFRWERVKK